MIYCATLKFWTFYVETVSPWKLSFCRSECFNTFFGGACGGVQRSEPVLGLHGERRNELMSRNSGRFEKNRKARIELLLETGRFATNPQVRSSSFSYETSCRQVNSCSDAYRFFCVRNCQFIIQYYKSALIVSPILFSAFPLIFLMLMLIYLSKIKLYRGMLAA